MTVNEIGWYDEREDKILFVNGTPVGNPPVGHIWLYADAAGALYTRTSAGVDAAVGGAGAVDASAVTYTPAVLADWDGSADPGDVDGALDQLAERVTDVEGATVDAGAVTYTPTVLTDWDSDADPGDVDGALDQLAERTDDLETTSHAAVTLGADAGAVLGLTGQQIDLDVQNANIVFAGPTTGAAADPTFRALVQADMPTQYTTLNFILGDGSNEIPDGVAGDIYFEAGYTISAWTLLADQSGAIKIDLWMDTYANYPPTNDDTITNAHEPEIAASGTNAQDTNLGDWGDVTIAAGQSIRVNVDSCTTITRCTLALKLLRS